MTIFLATLFILICVLLIGVILLQKGRGGGLAGAFGGAGGHTAFGSRTGDMFTWITVVLVGLFLLLGVVTVLKFRPAKRAPIEPAPIQQAPAETPATGEAATQPTDAATLPVDVVPVEGAAVEPEAPATQPAE